MSWKAPLRIVETADLRWIWEVSQDLRLNEKWARTMINNVGLLVDEINERVTKLIAMWDNSVQWWWRIYELQVKPSVPFFIWKKPKLIFKIQQKLKQQGCTLMFLQYMQNRFAQHASKVLRIYYSRTNSRLLILQVSWYGPWHSRCKGIRMYLVPLVREAQDRLSL